MFTIADRAELERRLGMPYKLDDSFASLWAIERLLDTVRRMPTWHHHVDWLTTYVADFICKAYSEMGIVFERSGNRISCANPDYTIYIDADIPRLFDAEGEVPTFYGNYWLGSPLFGRAALPFYVFAMLAQNHEWAVAKHEPIGKLHDHLDRVVPWLTQNTLAKLTLPPGLTQTDAESLVSAMVWPPLGYAMNEKGEYNLRKLAERVARVSDKGALRPFLRELAASQNHFLRPIAAAVCMVQGSGHTANPILPQLQNEALSYKEAISLFGLNPPPAVLTAISQYLPDDERVLVGRDSEDYINYGRAVGAGDYPAALEVLNSLVEASTENTMYLCSRGDVYTHLNQGTDALADFDASLRLYSGYWQARINRGVLHARAKNFALADADLFEAAKIRPGNSDTRNNLLCNYFFTKP